MTKVRIFRSHLSSNCFKQRLELGSITIHFDFGHWKTYENSERSYHRYWAAFYALLKHLGRSIPDHHRRPGYLHSYHWQSIRHLLSIVMSTSQANPSCVICCIWCTVRTVWFPLHVALQCFDWGDLEEFHCCDTVRSLYKCHKSCFSSPQRFSCGMEVWGTWSNLE